MSSSTFAFSILVENIAKAFQPLNELLRKDSLVQLFKLFKDGAKLPKDFLKMAKLIDNPAGTSGTLAAITLSKATQATIESEMNGTLYADNYYENYLAEKMSEIEVKIAQLEQRLNAKNHKADMETIGILQSLVAKNEQLTSFKDSKSENKTSQTIKERLSAF